METYKTKDIYEASAFIAKRMVLTHLERESNFFWFVFESPNKCAQFSSDYWNNKLLIRAKDYADAIRSLKDRVFASK